ncbi:MAG: hypothetical protein AAGC57_20705 [Pseudomonadota bacterium]
MKPILAAALLGGLAVAGCTDAGKRALITGGLVAADSYLTENPRIRQELTLGPTLATDAALALQRYQAARSVL